MKSFHLVLVIYLLSCQLVKSAPTATDARSDFFANIDYNQLVGHMKEFMMYLPVLMTTVKETVTGFPKISEGINSLSSRRYILGSGRQNDGKCRCKQLGRLQPESSVEDMGY